MTIIAPRHPAGTVVVIHAHTHEERTFTSTPREAVIAAYAADIGDSDSTEHEARYGQLVRATKLGWRLNNWWVRDPSKEPGAGKPEIVRSEVKHNYTSSEDKRLIAPNTESVTLCTYDVDEAGYMQNSRGRSFPSIVKDLNAALRKMPWPTDQDGGGDYGGFSFCRDHGAENGGHENAWPTEWQWISVFAVTGGSEGHYVHVEIIHRNGARQLVFLFKTFGGRAHAQLVTARTAALLGT